MLRVSSSFVHCCFFLCFVKIFYLFELRRNSTTSSFYVGPVFTMDDSVTCEAFSVEGQLEFSGCLAVCAPSIQLVTFERANASGVREPRVPAAAANQHSQRVVLTLHQVREAVGLHLVHLAQEVLQRLHSNRHGAQLPKSVDALCSATMQMCM